MSLAAGLLPTSVAVAGWLAGTGVMPSFRVSGRAPLVPRAFIEYLQAFADQHPPQLPEQAEAVSRSAGLTRDDGSAATGSANR